MKFKHKTTKGISKRPTEFYFDRLFRDLRSKEGKLIENYEENGYYVIVTLPFDPKASISIGFKTIAVSNHLAKTASKSVHPFRQTVMKI